MLCCMASEIDDAICVLYARTCCSICLNCYKDLSRKDCVHFHKFGLTNRRFSHIIVTVRGSSSRRSAWSVPTIPIGEMLIRTEP